MLALAQLHLCDKAASSPVESHHPAAAHSSWAPAPRIVHDLVVAAMIAAAAVGSGGALVAASTAELLLPAEVAALQYAGLAGLLAFVALIIARSSRLTLNGGREDAVRIMPLALTATALAAFCLSKSEPSHSAWIGFAALACLAYAGCVVMPRALSLLLGADRRVRLLNRRIAVFGAGTEADLLCDAAGRPGTAARIVGVFDDRRDESRRQPMKASLSGQLDDLVALIRRGAVDDIVVALPRWAVRRHADVIARLARYPVDVHVCAHLAESAGLVVPEDASVSALGPIALQRIHRAPLGPWGALAKDAMDRTAAAVLLVLLAPLFAIIAILIKRESKGPVFFRQKRHGLAEREIIVWKFRTMRVMENGPAVAQATRHDPRITRIGAILRRTSLDELPQLINVLQGSMSLVGPRPHAIAHNEFYGEFIDGYKLRHRLKPGITGLAQVRGYRGETKDPSLMQHRIDHDLRYIGSWSLWLDIKILLATAVRGFRHQNAF